MSPERVPPSKTIAAEIALVILCFEMYLDTVSIPWLKRYQDLTYTVIMSVEISLALEFLGAGCVSNGGGARVRILSVGIVCLHVRLPIVAPLEELSAHTAFVGSFFRCCSLALLLDPVDARQDRC